MLLFTIFVLAGVLIPFAVAAVVVVLAGRNASAAGRLWFERLTAFREAAADAGLTGVLPGHVPFPFPPSLEGQAGGLQVRLRLCTYRRHESGLRLEIRGLAGLSVRGEGTGTAIGKRFLGEVETELGDVEFDRRCFVSGPSWLALAILDAESRRRVLALLQGQLIVGERRSIEVQASLSDGALRLDCAESGLTSERARDLLRGGLDLARRLVAPADIPRRIVENLRTEPLPGVRLALLLTLARACPKNPATRTALRAARQDESAEVRLLAEMSLRDDDWKRLLELVASEATADGCAARAVAALGERLPNDDLARTLRQALSENHQATAIACVERLARRPPGTAEGSLLAALWNEHDAVRAAAARALGRVGTAQGVHDLRHVAEHGIGLARGAARQAIAEIQSRLPGASPGQLSLAGGEAGALSLAGEAPGALSLAGEAEASEPEAPPRAVPRPREHE